MTILKKKFFAICIQGGPTVSGMYQVVPQLQQQSNSHDLYFQQDGGPAHYLRAVREYLDEISREMDNLMRSN